MMENTRTLSRLRRRKNSVLINLLTLLLGVGLFSGIFLFEKDIMSLMRDSATGSLLMENQGNLGNAMITCEKAFGFLENAAITSILFSIEGFIFIFFYIRLSSKTAKLSLLAPILIGFGNLLLFTYYVLLGTMLPATGQLVDIQSDFNILKLSGILLILLANILFIYQVFIQVVLERIEE